MGMDDLSFLDMMGGGAGDTGEATGGVYVVGLDGAIQEGTLRLIGKARVVADALGAYVYLLTNADGGEVQQAISAGADQALIATGMPSVAELADFMRPRAPQVILFPHTPLGRVLGPGLAQVLGGSLSGRAADLAIDPVYQRIQAHQPVLDDAARQVVTLVNSPAVAVVDTGALPAPFSEPWRTGGVQETGLAWNAPALYEHAEYQSGPLTLGTAPVIVAGGRGLRKADGFELAERLAAALGGVTAGDLGALDAGWIEEDRLIGLTGATAAPQLYLALGIEGDTEHLGALQGAEMVIAVQPDPTAPITAFADWNILADPVDFAEALLKNLGA